MDRDLAWAAGLFEGEGCFTCQNEVRGKYNYVYALARVAMTDEDEVRDFARIMGVGNIIIKNPKMDHHLPQWVWGVYRYVEVRHVIMLLAPWLGSRRLVQAINALASDTRAHKAMEYQNG